MRNSFIWIAALVGGMALACANSGEGAWTAGPAALPATTTNSAAQSKQKGTVPAGMRILIRVIDSIDTNKQKTADRFTASRQPKLQAEDVVVAPRRSTVHGRLVKGS